MDYEDLIEPEYTLTNPVHVNLSKQAQDDALVGNSASPLREAKRSKSSATPHLRFATERDTLPTNETFLLNSTKVQIKC